METQWKSSPYTALSKYRALIKSADKVQSITLSIVKICQNQSRILHRDVQQIRFSGREIPAGSIISKLDEMVSCNYFMSLEELV